MNNEQLKDFINLDYSALGKYLCSLSPLELATLGSLIGIILIPPLTINEQNSIGNFFQLIGQVLSTSAAQGQLINPNIEESEFNEFKKKHNKDINFILELIKTRVK